MLARHALLLSAALGFGLACDSSSTPPAGPEQRTVTVTLRYDGGGGGAVTSDPAGLTCADSTCSGTFELGSTVTLTAVPAGARWVGWGGSCSGNATTCAIPVSHDLEITAVFLGANYAFVTSTTYGIAGLTEAAADAACTERAAAGGLPGTYVAWRASVGHNAVTRLGTARGWVRPDGLPVADTAAELVSTGVRYPPDVTELGYAAHGNVLTGTAADGELADDCDGWTTGGANSSLTVGDPSAGLGDWTESAALTCGSIGPIYCFGVDVAAPVRVTPASGRVAFVSAGTVTGAAGLAGFDALCAAEAGDAGLPGTYRAFVATGSDSAASRFDLTGPTWVRPDGLQVVIGAGDVAESEALLLAPILLNADGTPSAESMAWTGSNEGAVAGTATCADWSSELAEDRGAFGYVTSGQAWLGMMATSCNRALPIYCFQR